MEEKTHTQQDVWIAAGLLGGFVTIAVVGVFNAKLALIGLGVAFVLLIVVSVIYNRKLGNVAVTFPDGNVLLPGDSLRFRVRYQAPEAWRVKRAVARLLCVRGRHLTNSRNHQRTLLFQEEQELARSLQGGAERAWEMDASFLVPTEVRNEAWVDGPGLGFTHEQVTGALGKILPQGIVGSPEPRGFPGLQTRSELDSPQPWVVAYGPDNPRPVEIRWVVEVVLELDGRSQVETIERVHLVER